MCRHVCWGVRGCIGFNVALQEAKMALAELVFRYRFVEVSEEVVKYDPEFTMIRPVSLYVRAIRTE